MGQSRSSWNPSPSCWRAPNSAAKAKDAVELRERLAEEIATNAVRSRVMVHEFASRYRNRGYADMLAKDVVGELPANEQHQFAETIGPTSSA